MADLTREIHERVQQAVARKQALAILGNNTKPFLGNSVQAETLSLSEHTGILHYEPAELVMTARAGTTLQTIRQCLDEHGQMLGFEPPDFDGLATLGGTIACNLSGPRRPYSGAARDFVLGCRVINGHGQILHFGGEVMKNVAGYDISRLMSGALGTLGVLLDISIRVVPKPQLELTISKEVAMHKAIQVFARWGQRPLPVSAACHDGNLLHFRLSGNDSALKTAQNKIGGELTDAGLWDRLREHRLGFFKTGKPIWRLSVPAMTPMIDIAGKSFLDWGGAQRWMICDCNAAQIREISQRAGGHATWYRNRPDQADCFQALPAALLRVHAQLKQAFDPHALFNPGRLYRTL